MYRQQQILYNMMFFLLDFEECFCIFLNFILIVKFEYVYDLADLLDFYDYYGVKRSWKSLVEDVLNFDYFKIVVIG